MLLTIARLVAAPIVAGLILWADAMVFRDGRFAAATIYGVAAAVFVLAALTDLFDGIAARRLGAVTPLGAALDHAADKALTTAALIAMAVALLPQDLIIAALILIVRDVVVAGLREGLAQSGRALPVVRLGKWKMALEAIGIAAVLIWSSVALGGIGGPVQDGLWQFGRVCIWLAALLSVISAWTYVLAALRPQAAGGTQ
jgi:CDP-diacylglycerol--glycerol-3-phosphate 3-phosphatidyltransferase